MEKIDVFLNEDKYIGYNEYKNFCTKNNVEINEYSLNERNNKFVEEKLIEYKEYFDHILQMWEKILT